MWGYHPQRPPQDPAPREGRPHAQGGSGQSRVHLGGHTSGPPQVCCSCVADFSEKFLSACLMVHGQNCSFDLWIIYFSKVAKEPVTHIHILQGYAYCLSLLIRPYQSSSQLWGTCYIAFWLEHNYVLHQTSMSFFTAPIFFSDLIFSGILSHISTIFDIILSHGARDWGGNCLSDWRVGLKLLWHSNLQAVRGWFSQFWPHFQASRDVACFDITLTDFWFAHNWFS